MSNYKEITKCRCCESEVELLLDLTDQPLANSYHDPSENLEKFPLKLNLCKNCFHLQLSVVVDPDLMFKNYLYVSGTTQTLKDYFDFFAKFTVERFKNYFKSKPTTILDIACNDGTQLDSYKKLGLDTYGVDPAENLHELSEKNHTVYCDYFPTDKINKKYNLITAQNVFAHTHEILEFLRGCSQILDKQGILYIQTSQADMVLKNEFDTSYHEHLSFFNSLSMKTIVERAGLKLNNVFKFDIHGTSYIFEISHSDYDSNLSSVLELEKNSGIYDLDTYKLFAQNATKICSELKKCLDEHKDSGYKLIGYGAAAKGMTLLNFGDIQLDYIIDDNKLKQGLYTPGQNILIVPIDFLSEISSSQKIVFIPLAWNFFEEINMRIKKVRNVKEDVFIKYFPHLQITKNL